LIRPITTGVLGLCLLAGGLSGCALLRSSANSSSNSTAENSTNSPLKKLSPSVDAIQLDVLFVERPIGDPTLGSTLWSRLDQVSTLPAATLANLDRNGFRFGVAPSDPPPALQAALGMTGEMVPRDESQAYGFSGSSTARRSGEEISVDAWSGYGQCEIAIDRNGKPEHNSYQNARCVFRVKVERVQDGWAKLEITPEIHHGEMRLRRVADQLNWTTRPSQLIDPQYDQRFTVELNLGEMVVLGAGDGAKTSLGSHFFRGGTTDNHSQRLLIIRLKDMRRVQGIYQ
jgi:hypothetical protein